MRNQYGICDWYMAIPGPAAIEQAAKVGFDGIQISDLGGPARSYPLNDVRIQDMYRSAAQRYHIDLQGMVAGALMEHDGMLRPKGSAQALEFIDIFTKDLAVCSALGVHALIIPGLNKLRPSSDDEFENTCRMLHHLVDMASDANVQLTYESFLPTDKLVTLLNRISGLQVTWDTLNPVRYGFATPWEELSVIDTSRIDHVHVKDMDASHVGTCPMGDGVVGLGRSIDVLKHQGYTGWYISESFYYLPPHCQAGLGWDLMKRDLSYLQTLCEPRP